ncbi:hypothetical protein ABIE09_001739 [Lysobacter enzymogenes]|uniref:hypothetical protein n=1 Tax=Lysobacter enzymogenes TaxID=69 RepID=UPI003399B0CA
MEFDPDNLKVLARIRDQARQLDGLVRANPQLLDRMELPELIEMHGHLKGWRPLMLQAAREMGNLEVRIAKAVKRRSKVRA